MKRSKHVLTCGVLLSTLLTAAPVFADESDILNQILTVVTNISNYLGINITPDNQNQIPPTPATPNITQTETIMGAYQKNYNNAYVLSLPSTYNPAVDQPPSFNPPQSLNQQSIYNALTTTNAALIHAYMGELGITQSAPTSTNTYATSPSQQEAANENDKALNFDSLFGPSGYNTTNTSGTTSNSNTDPETLALNFIRFVSGLANPVSVASLNDLNAMGVSTAQRYDYLVALRSYIAAQSVGTSNLFQMLSRRHIYPGLGSSVGMKQADTVDSSGNVTQGAAVADASQSQVDDYVAQRRTTTIAWYQNMEKATPITVQRETLYVLAEIQASLNEMKKLDERILATLSAMQLMQLQTAKKDLNEKLLKLQQAKANAPTAPGKED